MKREFGKKLVENFLPRVDLTHVIDTSGAYIPGHGTPTVILLGRNRRPLSDTVRTVMGIKGEPATPEDPRQGLVWTSVCEQIDRPGSEGEFVSVADAPRAAFCKHPWSIGGGGATALKDLTENRGGCRLAQVIASIGFYQDTHADEAFVQATEFVCRHNLSNSFVPQVRGDEVRDWCCSSAESILFPYDKENLEQWAEIPVEPKWAWLFALRTTLWGRHTFGGGTYRMNSRPWFDYHQFPKVRARTPLSITFAFVATHNHFVLDRGGKVFNRSAPVIKLRAGASEADHLALLGLLNSSTACFWMKQVFHNKGSTVDSHGARQTTDAFENFYEFTGTGLQKFPVTEEKPLDLARTLDHLAHERQLHLPAQLQSGFPLSRADLDVHRTEAERLLGRMIALQEELDWRCYRIYGVTERDLCYWDDAGNALEPPEIRRGERSFEIAMARHMARGELETTWFERHRSQAITEIPAHWPADYRRLVDERIALIESERNVGLVERPEYKRRWNLEPWEKQEQGALRDWLLERLESEAYWPRVEVQSSARLAERAAGDAGFMQAAEVYRGSVEFDLAALVAELVEGESAPFLPVLRYKPTGLRKREIWARTWALQRREDAIDAEVEAALARGPDESEDQHRARVNAEQRRRKLAEIGDIPPPPKYRSADFLSTTCWRLRGGLDVPKERFVSLPHCARATDASLPLLWAGWDHLQQAQALAGYYVEMKDRDGWPPERLAPLLAGLLELVPWLEQWHNQLDPVHGVRMGDYYADFLREEARLLGLTLDAIRAWTPPTRARRRRKSATSG